MRPIMLTRPDESIVTIRDDGHVQIHPSREDYLNSQEAGFSPIMLEAKDFYPTKDHFSVLRYGKFTFLIWATGEIEVIPGKAEQQLKWLKDHQFQMERLKTIKG
jgi:hypothetical protein